jgi:hypothetical protein
MFLMHKHTIHTTYSASDTDLNFYSTAIVMTVLKEETLQNQQTLVYYTYSQTQLHFT